MSELFVVSTEKDIGVMGKGRNTAGGGGGVGCVSSCHAQLSRDAPGTKPGQVLQEPLLFPEGLQGFLQDQGAQGRGMWHGDQDRPRWLLHHVPPALTHTHTPLCTTLLLPACEPAPVGYPQLMLPLHPYVAHRYLGARVLEKLLS